MIKAVSIAMIVLIIIMAAMLGGGMLNTGIADRLGGKDFIPFTISLFTLLYVLLTALMLMQMTRVHESEFRPYISVDLIIEQHKVWVRVTNIGKSAAKDLVIRFSPDVKMKTGKTLNDSIFNGKVAYFPPGKEIMSFIDQSPDFLKHPEEEYSVSCSYRHAHGNKKFDESHSITVDYAKSVAFLVEYDVSDIYKQLQKLTTSVDSVGRGLQKIAESTASQNDR